MKYKAKLKWKEYWEFLNTPEKLSSAHEEYMKYFYGRWNEKLVYKLSKNYSDIITSNGELSSYADSRLENAMMINDYINSNNLYWDVFIKFDKYCVIKYGKVSMFVLDEFLDLIEIETYLNYTPTQLRQKLMSGDNSSNISNSLAELNNLTVIESKEKSKEVTSKIDILKNEIEDVKNCKHDELKEIQKEIDELIAIRKARQDELMAQLNEKMSEFGDELNKLKNQIFALKTEIYSIRCFAGETIELIQIRNGSNVPKDTPLIINQKILYLDEDLAKTVSLYSRSIDHDYKLLEEAIKYNDIVLEMFCPQNKCITFFKSSKSNEGVFYDRDNDILKTYDLVHGNKMGFVIRNGENVYIGWMEEEWDDDTSDKEEHIVAFTDSLIYKPETKTYSAEEHVPEQYTSVDHRVSRYFAISIIQGLIQHENILEIPEDVNVMLPSKYIIHNYADAWIEDNRFGDFATLVENLREYNHYGDKILLIQSVNENNYKAYSGNRSIGERNTTRDCSVGSGLYNISVISDGEVYISVEKDRYIWNEGKKNNANFRIADNEYVNLTYMNSIWLKYYIDTKRIGNFGVVYNQYNCERKLTYSYLIKYFKMAYGYVCERENKEKELISKYIENIDTYEWQELLSHWKIYNDVREITDFQAKRFAKYLQEGKYYKIKNLFSIQSTIDKINPLCSFFTTKISSWSRTSTYSANSQRKDKYGWIDTEFCNKSFKPDTPIEEISSREIYDEEKINYEHESIINWAKENNVDIANDKHLKKLMRRCVNNRNIFATIPNLFNKLVDDLNDKPFDLDEYFDLFISDLNRSKYYWFSNLSSKLYKLGLIYCMQEDFYTQLCDCIYNTIKWNNAHQIEYI